MSVLEDMICFFLGKTVNLSILPWALSHHDSYVSMTQLLAALWIVLTTPTIIGNSTCFNPSTVPSARHCRETWGQSTHVSQQLHAFGLGEFREYNSLRGYRNWLEAKTSKRHNVLNNGHVAGWLPTTSLIPRGSSVMMFLHRWCPQMVVRAESTSL